MGQAESQVPDVFLNDLREELSKKYVLPESLMSDRDLVSKQTSGLPAARREGDVSSNSGVEIGRAHV